MEGEAGEGGDETEHFLYGREMRLEKMNEMEKRGMGEESSVSELIDRYLYARNVSSNLREICVCGSHSFAPQKGVTRLGF